MYSWDASGLENPEGFWEISRGLSGAITPGGREGRKRPRQGVSETSAQPGNQPASLRLDD